MRYLLPVLTYVLAVWGCGGSNSTDAFIDWQGVHNPVLSAEDRALKDVAVAYDPSARMFYVFASTRFEASDPEADTKVQSFYRTHDFKTFELFADRDLNGPGYGPGSPDVSRLQGRWNMVFQASSGSGDARVLMLSTSMNLLDWDAPRALAPDVLDPTLRNIDGALAEEDGYFYLGWKQVQSFFVTRSQSRALDGTWLPALPATAGSPGEFAENFQFIKIDGTWRMIATGRDPGPYRCDSPLYQFYTCDHEPFIFTMDGSGTALDDWTRWIDKTHLEVPFEEWNTVMHANSAFLTDWRAYDGYFYLFYAGSDDGNSFALRGHGKIGMVRSHDLVEWRLPGDMR